MQPKVYVSCSPANPSAVFALFYCEFGGDIHGWHIEAKGRYFSAAFFMVENFYAARAPHLFRSIEDDAYGPWTIDYPPTKDEIRCPVPDTVIHELERMQSKFIDEWLFFKSDPHSDMELQAFEEHGLAVQEVNVKPRRMGRLHSGATGTTYMAPGTDPNLVQLVRKYWRLSEKVPAR